MHPFLPPAQMISLADTFGLPLFVYDAATIDRQILQLKGAFQVPSLDIRYACKALSTIGILKHIHQHGCGIDTVSPGEIIMALQAGVPPSQISFTPSGVLTEEYAFAIEKGVHIHVDQIHILEWLDQHYPGHSITLRFNPAIQAGGHSKLQVGSDGSKFGIMTNHVQAIIDCTRSLSLKVTGVHMHLGSDIGDSGSFDEAYSYLLEVAMHWADTLERIDLGGGFKIPYHPGDHAIDIAAFGKKVSKRFIQFCESVGRDLTMVLEPGKFLVSAAGYLLMEVTSVRHNSDPAMAFVSSGFNHFLRPMSYGAYHHLINLSNPDGPIHHYDVVGYLCETDTFASNRPIHEIRKGDILCLMNAGAYGYTMASTYNGRPRPAEVLVGHNGQPSLIRRAETIGDILRTDLGYPTT
jgi:diaminopimelate decarboxylase